MVLHLNRAEVDAIAQVIRRHPLNAYERQMLQAILRKATNSAQTGVIRG